ncbi:MAG: hypothetical protein IIA23_11335 [Chloroflexi bacterium]|nr:hypothetical protein [Chloroflexota bacterium]
MTINIPLKAVAFVLYTLALLGGAFGISYAVFEWRHDDDEKDVATEVTADEEEKSFSMTLETDEDFKEAARRIGALTPEFDCAGEFHGNPETGVPRGTLACDAGLTGFSCRYRPDASPVSRIFKCTEGEQLTDGFPVCSVNQPSQSTSRHIIRCSDPDGAVAVCEVHVGGQGVSLTCQRP